MIVKDLAAWLDTLPPDNIVYISYGEQAKKVEHVEADSLVGPTEISIITFFHTPTDP